MTGEVSASKKGALHIWGDKKATPRGTRGETVSIMQKTSSDLHDRRGMGHSMQGSLLPDQCGEGNWEKGKIYAVPRSLRELELKINSNGKAPTEK